MTSVEPGSGTTSGPSICSAGSPSHSAGRGSAPGSATATRIVTSSRFASGSA